MASQGIVPVYNLVRGTTLPPLTIRYSVNSAIPPIASAQFAVAKGGDPFFVDACTVATGATTKDITTPGADAETTKTWPLGIVTWSVRTITESGVVKEWATGTYDVTTTPQPTK